MNSTTEYSAPVADGSTDLIYAASVFTHMLPGNTRHYFNEAGRVLRPGGRCVFSFFLLENYRPKQVRPQGFARADSSFDHRIEEFGEEFAIVDRADPERMTAYSLDLVRRFAASANLEIVGEPLPGLWSGSFDAPVSSQDIVILRKLAV